MTRDPRETPASDADEQLLDDIRTGKVVDPADPAARAAAQARADVESEPYPPLDVDQILGKP